MCSPVRTLTGGDRTTVVHIDVRLGSDGACYDTSSGTGVDTGVGTGVDTGVDTGVGTGGHTVDDTGYESGRSSPGTNDTPMGGETACLQKSDGM